MAEESEQQSRIWHEKLSLWVLVLLALGLPIAFPELGVLGSFAIAIAVAVIARNTAASGIWAFGGRSPGRN